MKTKKMGLATQMIIALILGVVVGAIMQKYHMSPKYIKPFGDIFIRLVKMLVVPLLIGSLISGTAAMNNMRKLGRIAVKSIVFYIVTITLAIVTGIVVANIVQPGAGVVLSGEVVGTIEAKQFPGFLNTIISLIPNNVVKSMANGELLPLIVFSVFFGFCLTAMGEKGKPLAKLVDTFAQTMYKMTAYVMKYAPIGAFALIANTVALHGLDVILPLGKMIITTYLTLFFFILFVYAPIVKFHAKVPISQFLKEMREPLLVAFSTTSSMASMPSNMRAAERLGVSKDMASFLIPLGNTVNMAGAAMYVGIVSNFVAQSYGMTLTIGDQFILVLTALMLAIGAVGIPGYMIVMLTTTFSQVGIPLDGISLVAGVDKILDMARTPCNVIGDAAIALSVAKSEGNLHIDDKNETVLRNNNQEEAS